ncbi:MAG: ArsR/SmtB family transcription factor [Jatrophihabitans sp.]
MSSGEVVAEVQEISAPEQYKALAHPLRQRLLWALGERPATISQLTAQLGVQKGNVAHHLKVLRDAGIVRVGEHRQVRGGTEQYYQRVARKLVSTMSEPDSTAAMLGAVALEVSAAEDDALLQLRHVRLSVGQAARLSETLSALVDEAVDAGRGAPRYGVLVGVYQRSAR